MNDVANSAMMAPLASEITGEWPRFVEVWEEFRIRHGYFLRAELGVNREAFLIQALWQAQGSGHLQALLLRLQEAGLTGPGLAAQAAPFVANGFRLQSYVNGQWQPQDALITGRRYLQACDHVCRISVDGKHRGTGVLVRPTVVATAAHVIEPLVGPAGQADPGSVSRLAIHFFHADDLLPDGDVKAATPTAATLLDDWLGAYSPRATGEGGALYPINSVTGIDTRNGPWDFALIRLAAPPRAGLPGYPLAEGSPRKVKFGIHVLHHPAQALGQPMGLLWSIGAMNEALGEPTPLRWLHDANTDPGSSGAPCFDHNDWKIVALHQAGANDVNAENQNNRAVPIHGWAPQIDRLAETKDLTPYLAYAVDENRVKVPVLGRRLLQRRAWRAMTSLQDLKPQQRTFVVLGDSGSGKSFTATILSELARQAGCVLASLDVRNAVDATPLAFAQQLLEALGAERPEAACAASGLTTELRDVRNEIVPQMGQAIRALSGGRSVWLVLDGLEVCDTAARGAAQVIEGLLAALQDVPMLCLALIGWKGQVSAEHVELLPPSLTAADIVDHLLLASAPAGFKPDKQMRASLESYVRGQSAPPTEGAPYTRAVAVTQAASAALGSFIASAVAATGGNVP